MEIRRLASCQNDAAELTALLQAVVADGASIGFMPPLSFADGVQYWQSVEQDLRDDGRDLIGIFADQRLLGCAQLAYCHKANGRHRGEIEKVMVHPDARGRGYGRALMQYLEQLAHARTLRLLVLDTRLGDVASALYRSLGYVEAGQIPGFALSANGQLDATVIFYKTL